MAAARKKHCCLLLLLLSLSAFAQTRDRGVLRGRVWDQSGAAVAGAQVQLSNPSIGISRTVRTDNLGAFQAAGLPLTGIYSITVTQTGFSPAERTAIQLQADQPAEVDFRLSPSGGSVSVDVEGAADTVQTQSTQLQTRFDSTKLNETPVLGRRLTTAPLLNSAVRPARGTGDLFLNNTLFIINGSGRRQTTWSVDNSTGDDAWGRQSLFTTIPFSTVQEMTVITNATSAEYGRSMGSAVNVVTKSGTNDFHGDLIGMWRPGPLEANLPLANFRTADRLWQGSATVSGPVVKDRTFFLISNEYNNQIRDSVYNVRFLPGASTAAFPGEFAQDLFLARLDHHLSDRNTIFLRANFDRFHDTNPADAIGGNNQPTAARIFRRHTYALQLSDTAALTNSLVNEARVSFQLGSPITQFTDVFPSTQFIYPGFATVGESRTASLLNHQYQFADTIAWVRGRHSLRFGADVIYSSNGGFGQEFGGGFVLGQFTVKPGVTKSPDQLTIADMQRYQQSFGNQNYNVTESLLGAFVQDNFSVTHDLTLNLGVRYDYQTFTGDPNNVQPRLGFSYRLPGSANRTTVLRGSYGIFVSEVRANLAAGYKINGPQGIFTFSAAPGQLGFPTTLQPLTAFPTGAVLPPRDITVNVGQRAYLNQFFDVSRLRFYPDQLLNPYTQQWSFGMEHEIMQGLVFSMDYLGQRTLNIERPADLNAPDAFIRTAPGQIRSAAAADATRPITPVPNGFRRIVAVVNAGDSSYNGLQTELRKQLSHNFSALLSYTWSHTLNTVETDVPQQDPNENACFVCEKATSLLDQRHRVSASGWYQLPWRVVLGAWVTAGSGRPFNILTGADNNGDASNSDRPVINGTVIARNAGRTDATYDISLFLEKSIHLTERANLSVRGEGFNMTNHSNIVGRNATYGNLPSGLPLATFNQPLPGINNTDPGRQFQFQLRLNF